MKNTKYITTPLYYVNDDPHIGHAYTQVAGDVLARYYRSRGEDVFFLTGTDEHGQKIEKAAAKSGNTPKEHTDKMVKRFKNLWEKLNISNDGFIRTTDSQHKKIVQKFLQELYKKGKIEKRSYSGWYCVPDERFWKKKDLKDGKCPECGREVERIEEENYFFLMSEYQTKLINYIEDNPDYIMPEMRRNEVLGFLKNNELDDLCISRPKSRLNWGITIPFDNEYVTYVWFDALINYYSATEYIAPKDITWWPASCHLIGKDILTTHSVYWSTMLMALDLKLPRKIFAHGWWTITGEKMSKSLGNVVAPLDVIEKWNVDSFRYFLLRQVTFGMDGNFSQEQFKNRYESDLANELGNLLSRVLGMIEKYTPQFRPGQPDGFDVMVEDIVIMNKKYYEELKFDKILKNIWKIIKKGNSYIEEEKPWILNREKSTDRLNEVLTNLFNILRVVAQQIYPFMPETSQKMRRQMGIQNISRQENLRWNIKLKFDNVSKGKSLFPKK
ncbi:MAG: methionine--tRNA ligase [Elusimicrobiota bacterium]